ncbi:MAG: hypothetical protein ACLT1W_11595 [Alistipes onderdonkii]
MNGAASRDIDEPVMPGAIVEAMAQCSGILVLATPDPENIRPRRRSTGSN